MKQELTLQKFMIPARRLDACNLAGLEYSFAVCPLANFQVPG